MPNLLELTDIQWTENLSDSEMVRETNERLRQVQEFVNTSLLAIDSQMDIVEADTGMRTGEFSYQNTTETILAELNADGVLTRIGLLAANSTPTVSVLRIGSDSAPVTSPTIVGVALTTSYQYFTITSGGTYTVGDTIGLTLTGGSNNETFSVVTTREFTNQPFD